MKYFSPSYWFKLWVLSAPLFNDKKQCINAMSIDNKKIKNWASNNTTLEVIKQEMIYTNSSTNYQPYNLSQTTSQNIDFIYQTNLDSISSQELETSTHKHRHEKSRYKRQNNSIFKLTIVLSIENETFDNYRRSITDIIQLLISNNILTEIFQSRYLSNIVGGTPRSEDTPRSFDDTPRSTSDNIDLTVYSDSMRSIYQINTNTNYQYFSITVKGKNNYIMYLIFRISDLYLIGFINNNTYYYFQSYSVRNEISMVSQSFQINSNHNLGFDSNYNTLLGENNIHITSQSIFNAFNEVLRINSPIQANNWIRTSRRSLGIIIIATSEVLRFRSIHNYIFNFGADLENHIYWVSPTSSENNISIRNIVTNWNSRSQIVIQEINSLTTRVSNSNQITDNDNNSVFNWISNLPSTAMSQSILSEGIRIIYGIVLLAQMECSIPKRNKRYIIKNSIEKFCNSFKGIADFKNRKITTFKILNKDHKNGNLKTGTIYVGTNEGVFLVCSNGIINKFDNLNFSIKDINLDDYGSVYAINEKEEIYDLNSKNWTSEKIINMESSNLNKELKIYYNNDKKNKIIIFSPNVFPEKNHYKITVQTLNLYKFNPLNYQKIDFLGDVNNNCWGSSVNWGSSTYKSFCDMNMDETNPYNQPSSRSIKKFLKDRNNEFHDIIENTKEQVTKKKKQILQRIKDDIFLSSFSVRQKFALAWYSENKNYYLKVFTFQYCESDLRIIDLKPFNCSIKIGSGIRLYNDNLSTPTRTKRDNVISNAPKWDDNFAKFINYEENLSIISNNTNFVSNNVTSL